MSALVSVFAENCVFWLSVGKIEAMEVFCEAGGWCEGGGSPSRHDFYRTARYLVIRCDEKADENHRLFSRFPADRAPRSDRSDQISPQRDKISTNGESPPSKCIELCVAAFIASESNGASSCECTSVGFC